LVAVLVLVAAVALRTVSQGKIEIKLNDAIIAAIAVALALLLSGRITKLAVGSGGLTVETAILKASAKPIAQQVTALPVVRVEEALKGGVDEIRSMVDRKVQGLDFLLGAGGYQPDVIQQYLSTLTNYTFFRFVILLDRDRNLVAVVDGNKLFRVLSDPASGQTFAGFAALINRASGDDVAQLAKLPGYVPATAAVSPQADKRDVLEQMEKLATDWLPVVKDGKFAGVVERSQLTASLILDVTNQLRAEAAGQP
jgi:CBS domain protein